jgi:molybdopterin/thiamine biosynthesis adenylyltransferase/rhodanese-related sulfurtransferase
VEADRARTPSEIDVEDFSIILDIRERGHFIDEIPGSVWADPQDVGRIEELIPDPGSSVLIYCGIGVRSAAVADMLRQRGYPGVTSLAGGIRRWRSEGRSVIDVDGQPEDRYDRHIRLDGFGPEGQDRVRDARVLVVGAGGLGSPVIQYLATAGVATIGIVDGDRVDTTNLQRQVIFSGSDIGLRKPEAARARVRELNPEVDVVPISAWLDPENARNVAGDYQILIDASDNYATRLAANDAAVDLGMPFVHGAAIRWEGMVAAFDPRVGPCYRCLFPDLPEHEEVCSDVGVLGAVTGVIGSLMAVEAIKHIIGARDRTVDRLITYDARSSRFTSLKIERSGSCPAQSGRLST